MRTALTFPRGQLSWALAAESQTSATLANASERTRLTRVAESSATNTLDKGVTSDYGENCPCLIMAHSGGRPRHLHLYVIKRIEADECGEVRGGQSTAPPSVQQQQSLFGGQIDGSRRAGR